MATPLEWLNEFQVNTGAANNPNASQPQITGLSNGNFLVTWVEAGTNGVATQAGNDIVGKIFDAEGNVVRDSFRVNTNRTAHDESDFDVAATNDGGFVVVFVDRDGADTDVIYQRHNSAGNMTTERVILTETTANFAFENPQITVNLANNTSVLQFNNNSGGDQGMFQRTLDATGNVTFAGGIMDDGTRDEFDGDVAFLTNGNTVHVWTDTEPDNDSIDILIEQPNGTNITSVLELDDTGRNAQVAALSNGNFVVVWEDFNTGGGDIRAWVLTPTGTSVNGPFAIASGANSQNEPDVIGLPDGDFVVVWDDDTTDQLLARQFNANGTTDGSTFVIDNVNGTTPSLSATADGRILIAWEDAATDNIFASIWDPRDGSIVGDQFINSGNVTILNNSGPITGGPNGGTITGTDFEDTIIGQNGNDLIIGGLSLDTIDAGGGNDTIRIFNNEFSDNIDGGAGTVDTLDLSQRTTGSGAVVDLRNDTYSLQGLGPNSIVNVERVFGTQLNDTFSGGGSGFDSFFAGNGNDTFLFRIGDGFPDFHGQGGTDTADFSSFPTTDFFVDLASGGYRFGTTTPGAFSGDLTSVENYVGGGGMDVVIGNASNNVINGGAGIDDMSGGLGNDRYIVGLSGDI
ncbi:MAG: hypothetical protein OXR62_03940, partial [Ahrensia sp.]|nr:hypothetical protein [Ahrensia sp.]